MADRLPTRTYTLTWHWRTMDTINTDLNIQATSVPAAITKLTNLLSAEYADVKAQLVVISAPEVC